MQTWTVQQRRAGMVVSFSVLMSLLLLSACDSGNVRSGDGIALRVFGGNLQTGFLGRDLPESLSVQVVNEGGTPVPGAVVMFRLLTGEGEGKADVDLLSPEATTDANGVARCAVRLGSTPGMARVTAVPVGATAVPVIFNLSSFPEPTATRKPVSFVSINDFHCHLNPWGEPDNHQGGLARVVWLLKEIRARNDEIGVPTVIFNAGDDFENTVYHDVPGYLAWQLGVWDRAGIDFWQVGNHDYQFGVKFLGDIALGASETFTDGAKGHPMELTFGNVDPSTLIPEMQPYAGLFETDFSDREGLKLFQQTAVLDLGGMRIGVIGVVTSVAIYSQVPGNAGFMALIGAGNPYSQNMTFFKPDPRKNPHYINKAIDSLASQDVDVILVNSHTGLGFGDRVNIPPGKDDIIARYGQGSRSGRTIDMIVSSHSHVQLNHPIYVTNPNGTETPLIQAREGGLFASRVNAVVDTENGGMEVLDSLLIQVNSDLQEDPQIVAEAKVWDEKAHQQYPWMDEHLVDSSMWLSHRANTDNGLGNLICNAFDWKLRQEGYSVDASMAIPSLYREDIWRGSVTGNNGYDVLPIHVCDDIGTTSEQLTLLKFPGRKDRRPRLLPCSPVLPIHEGHHGH